MQKAKGSSIRFMVLKNTLTDTAMNKSLLCENIIILFTIIQLCVESLKQHKTMLCLSTLKKK